MTGDPHRRIAVATAIRRVVGDRLGRARSWSDLPKRLQDEYLAEADAAIEAYESFDGITRVPLAEFEMEGL